MSASIAALVFIVQAGILFLLWSLSRWHKESRVDPRARRNPIPIATIQPTPQPAISLISMSWWIAPAAETSSSAASLQQRMQLQLNATRRHGVTG